MYDNHYLCHDGQKGMRWGYRQWQNEDGTYTEEGKRRRREQYAKAKFATSLSSTSVSAMKEGSSLLRKAPKRRAPRNEEAAKLSDDELRAAIKRLEDEKRFNDLVGYNQYVKTGKEKAADFLDLMGSLVGMASGVAALIAVYHQVTSRSKDDYMFDSGSAFKSDKKNISGVVS